MNGDLMDLSFEQISKEFEILGYTKKEAEELAELAMRDCSSISDEEIESVADAYNRIPNTYDLFLYELQSIKVVEESGNIIASTDFTNEKDNLEVWTALGLDKEDFYK